MTEVTRQTGFSCCSEVLAAESVSCLNKALCHLKDIWEEIGIPEDQRLQRTSVVKTHIKVRRCGSETTVSRKASFEFAGFDFSN